MSAMNINSRIFHAEDLKYRGILGRYRWSMCIGAGTSAQIAPTWSTLAYKAFQHCVDSSMTETVFEKMVKENGWGLDHWIQAAQNQWLISGKTKNDFALLLREILYEDILREAAKCGLKDLLILSFNDPFRMHYAEIEKLCSFISECYPDNSTIQLVNFILDCYEAGKSPVSIISFNADAIFDAFLYLFFCKRLHEKQGIKYKTKRPYTRVLRAIEFSHNLIPIFHIHGCLFPNHGIQDWKKRSSSISKLVFNETAYTELAGTTYNWGQTTFLYHAQFDQLLFVGLSMSDPNLRKWLSWTTGNYNEELLEARKREFVNLKNFWICKGSPSDLEYMQNSIVHLGTRICTIPSWGNLYSGLSNLLGV